MAFIPAFGVSMVEVRYQYGGVQSENTLYFDRGQEQEVSEMATLVTRIADWWNGQIKSSQSNTLYLREVTLTNLSMQGGLQLSDVRYANVAGGVTSGTEMPGNVSFCISFRTGYRGRNRRGRNYTTALRSGQMNGPNAVTSSYAVAMKQKYETLLPGGSYDPAPYRWCIISRYLDNQPLEEATVVPITTVMYTNLYVDSQRRRLYGRGT